MARIVRPMLALVALLAGLVVGLTLLPAGETTAQTATSTLTIVSPTEGAVLTGDTVTVTFQAEGITFVTMQGPGGPNVNRPGEGHLHLQLDLVPVTMLDKGSSHTFRNVPAGEHRLVAELVGNDHKPLSPRVIREVRFQVVPGVPRAGEGGTAAADEIALIIGLSLVVSTTLSLAAITGWRRRGSRMA